MQVEHLSGKIPDCAGDGAIAVTQEPQEVFVEKVTF